jgi:uncharacterized protein
MARSPPVNTPTLDPSPRRVVSKTRFQHEGAPSARRGGETVRCSVKRSGIVVPLVAALWALALLLATAAVAEPTFPALTGRVVDEASILSADDRRVLEADLKALEEKSTDQLVVYTARSLQGYPIEDFGYRLGRAWAIGQAGKNNGAILIVAPNERKVRIEVGRGLEPQLTDIMTKLIIENAILPAFRRGDFAGGVKAGVRDIRDVLLGDAEAVKQRAKGAAKRSPGAGSFTSVAILAILILFAVTIVWVQSMQTAHPNRAVRDRRRRDDSTEPASTWGSSSSSWDSGGSSSGGFSGGGGDFGGGGSSGSW